ncbi:hypothetical protein EYC84_001286 [Monilinia fructicola]|uniref:Uncharacterized protein n=1 Tax=Monilinia fructicola TaxID=38448 RepID=A0A5M9JMS5_MONFR|nr:hypothetical protein EYC84_001286 [Monilinia fructicola]
MSDHELLGIIILYYALLYYTILYYTIDTLFCSVCFIRIICPHPKLRSNHLPYPISVPSLPYQHHTIPYHTIPYHTIQHNTASHNSTQFHTRQSIQRQIQIQYSTSSSRVVACAQRRIQHQRGKSNRKNSNITPKTTQRNAPQRDDTHINQPLDLEDQDKTKQNKIK